MASGATLAVFDALASRPPASGYPQIDLRNGHAVLGFDDAADEATDFAGVLPANYAGGDLVAELRWAAATAVSGDARWEASFERHDSAHDLDSDAFSAAVGVTSTTAAAAGALVAAQVTLPAAAIGSPGAGESYRLRIARAADDAADTLVGDAELLTVELREA